MRLTLVVGSQSASGRMASFLVVTVLIALCIRGSGGWYECHRSVSGRVA